MNYFNKIKSYLIFAGYIFIINIMISIIYYYSNIGSKISNLLLFIFTLLGFIIFGLFLGLSSNTNNKKRGLINSLIICFILFIFSIFSGSFLSIRKILYYIILIASCTGASIIGFKIKKDNT